MTNFRVTFSGFLLSTKMIFDSGMLLGAEFLVHWPSGYLLCNTLTTKETDLKIGNKKHKFPGKLDVYYLSQ